MLSQLPACILPGGKSHKPSIRPFQGNCNPVNVRTFSLLRLATESSRHQRAHLFAHDHAAKIMRL
jgi:hypothetical protein